MRTQLAHFNALPPFIVHTLVHYNALTSVLFWPRNSPFKCWLIALGKIFRAHNAKSNPINNLDTRLKG
jgi:hypothetical protein